MLQHLPFLPLLPLVFVHPSTSPTVAFSRPPRPPRPTTPTIVISSTIHPGPTIWQKASFEMAPRGTKVHRVHRTSGQGHSPAGPPLLKRRRLPRQAQPPWPPLVAAAGILPNLPSHRTRRDRHWSQAHCPDSWHRLWCPSWRRRLRRHLGLARRVRVQLEELERVDRRNITITSSNMRKELVEVVVAITTTTTTTPAIVMVAAAASAHPTMKAAIRRALTVAAAGDHTITVTATIAVADRIIITTEALEAAVAAARWLLWRFLRLKSWRRPLSMSL